MNQGFIRSAGMAVAAALATMAGCAQIDPAPVVRHGHFFSGGEYVGTGGGRHMSGQMYVEYRIPARVTKPFPIVMIHGGGQTGTNFLTTPDGRPGWAEDFAAMGYAVYVVDQPARGRSAYHADTLGRETVRSSPERVRQMFTDSTTHRLWPKAGLHSQWPATAGGSEGDPVFDQFYASQVPWTGHVRSEEMVRKAAGLLLDRIGPAILLTHSQSGPYGWAIADEKPDKVKAIVTVEPNGPPFVDIDFVGAPDWYKVLRPARVYGLTWTPIRFDPPVTKPEELRPVAQTGPERDGAIACHLQAGATARRVPSLAKIPVAVVTGEASFRAGVDHCTVRFLEQAGVATSHLRLEEYGQRGNGHMMMLEKNSRQIAGIIDQWLSRQTR